MFKRLTSISIIILLVTGCSLRGGDKTTPVTVHNDSMGNVMQVTAQLTQDNATEILKSRAASQENAGYFAAQKALYSNPNLDGKDFAIMFMAQGLAGNKVMPTNSNDVKIAEVNASVQKHSIWGGVTKFGFGAVAGGSTAVRAIDAFAGLAGAAGTVINNTGDGNDIDTTQNDVNQTATDNSTITDSGNIDQAKGIPLNSGDLAPVALGTPPAEEEGEMAEGVADTGENCSCPPGLTPRPDDPGFCSDGMGGGQPAICE